MTRLTADYNRGTPGFPGCPAHSPETFRSADRLIYFCRPCQGANPAV
ncbi:Uncharacterized protein dnm_082400 [Desulfonema magnum]|uniref:Uncharacterized protein n=1 Tax=Desulfonema magnum TaxID=45655 RepID=A0A975BUU8_9BACT|nr:Uncharacterized protein dnm_082400 [Desulfonema magnum]